MESINTVFIIAGVLAVFILLLIQWFVRKDSKDKKILRRPPYFDPLPQHDLEIATREWQSWRSKYQNMATHEKNRLQNEYVKRERAFMAERDAFHDAQKPYQVACEELEISWRNFRDIFNSMGFFQRWFAGDTSREVARLRQVYLEVEKKVKWERDKWFSRKRIKRVEEEATKLEPIEKRVEEPAESIEEVPDEVEPMDGSDEERIEEMEIHEPQDKEEEFHESLIGKISTEVSDDDIESPEQEVADVHFTQDDVKTFYPDFREKTYIDEIFMPDPFYAGTIKNADFVKTKFVGVQFKGVHQYQKCKFQGADFSAAVFFPNKKPHRFLYCNFTKSRWNGAVIEVAAFYLCKFKGVKFRNFKLNKVKFVQCDLSEALLKGADLSRCVMSRDMLDSLDFSECKSPPANFQINESEEIEPDGNQEGNQDESFGTLEDMDLEESNTQEPVSLENPEEVEVELTEEKQLDESVEDTEINDDEEGFGNDSSETKLAQEK